MLAANARVAAKVCAGICVAIMGADYAAQESFRSVILLKTSWSWVFISDWATVSILNANRKRLRRNSISRKPASKAGFRLIDYAQHRAMRCCYRFINIDSASSTML